MANKNLFQTLRGAIFPKTNAVNEEGAPAYALEPKQALAQYAATGCFSRTFYATAEEQVQREFERTLREGAELMPILAEYYIQQGKEEEKRGNRKGCRRDCRKRFWIFCRRVSATFPGGW